MCGITVVQLRRASPVHSHLQMGPVDSMVLPWNNACRHRLLRGLLRAVQGGQ
jgi:hypothetical protein